MKQKVLFIGKYPPIIGGTSTGGIQIIEVLNRHYSVDIITLNIKSNPYEQVTYFENKEAKKPQNGHIHYLDSKFGISFIPHSDLHTIRIINKGLELCDTNDYKFILSYYLFPFGLSSLILGASVNKPVYVLHAGSDISTLGKETDLRRTLIEYLPKAKMIISSSRSTLNEIVPIQNLNVSNLLGPLPMPYYFDKTENDNRIKLQEWFTNRQILLTKTNNKSIKIVIIGKVSAGRQFKNMLDLLREVSTFNIQVQLFHVAYGKVERIRNIANKYKLYTNKYFEISLLKPIPHSKIPTLLRLMDCGMMVEKDFPVSFHSSRLLREYIYCNLLPICYKDSIKNMWFKNNLVHSQNIVLVENQNIHDLARILVDMTIGVKRESTTSKINILKHNIESDTSEYNILSLLK